MGARFFVAHRYGLWHKWRVLDGIERSWLCVLVARQVCCFPCRAAFFVDTS